MPDDLQGRTGFGGRVFKLRWLRLGLSQAQFADRYGFTLGALKDLEQNRVRPPRTVVVLVAAIENAPDRIASIVEREKRGGRLG